MPKFVIPAGKRVSSAMDGELKYVHVAWIPAIPAGMTGFLVRYNDKSRSLETSAFVFSEPDRACTPSRDFSHRFKITATSKRSGWDFKLFPQGERAFRHWHYSSA